MGRIQSNPERRKTLGRGPQALALGLLCLMLSARTGAASTESELQQVDPRDFPKASYHEGLAAVRLGDTYGYIDPSGRVVISPRFQFAHIFSEGLARVVTDDRSGYIDQEGRVVIAPRFHKSYKFSDGLARVCAPPKHPTLMFRVMRLMLWDDHNAYPCGYIDRKGKLVIDYQYLPSHGFRNGYARVTTLDGQEGYIDHAGKFDPTHEAPATVEIADVVVDAMQSYARAQQRHFAKYGRYSDELSDLSNLPLGMAGADLENPEADFHGYLFESVGMNGAAKMDYGKDFLLVAFPARYLVSGRESYAIGPKGIVIVGNSHGDPIYTATQLTAWHPVKN